MDKETVEDAKLFDATPSNSSAIKLRHGTDDGRPPRVPFNMSDLYYNMNGDKYLHIFNHYEYENSGHYGPNSKYLKRVGTQEDVIRLKNTFDSLGFTTTVHNDLHHQDILQKMMEVCSKDHSATSCLAVVILTHGQNGGVLLAADQPYYFKELTDIMKHGHTSLVGKPKLFFVQACRSGHLPEGNSILFKKDFVLPMDPDTLVVFSSSPHYFSYRNCDGSWLMQSLCDVLEDHHEFLDLLQMLTLVNQDVAYKVTYNEKDPAKSNKKQMPETRHRLTKLLKF